MREPHGKTGHATGWVPISGNTRLMSVLLLVLRAERATSRAPVVAGFDMDGDICPGVLYHEIRFEMVGKIMGLVH